MGCIQKVVSKKSHCCKLKFVIDVYNKWIYQKFKKQRLSLDLGTNNRFRKENPVDYDDKCCICGFELGVIKTYGADPEKKSYCDFVIKKFLENIFSKEELQSSETICDLKIYY